MCSRSQERRSATADGTTTTRPPTCSGAVPAWSLRSAERSSRRGWLIHGSQKPTIRRRGAGSTCRCSATTVCVTTSPTLNPSTCSEAMWSMPVPRSVSWARPATPASRRVTLTSASPGHATASSGLCVEARSGRGSISTPGARVNNCHPSMRSPPRRSRTPMHATWPVLRPVPPTHEASAGRANSEVTGRSASIAPAGI